MIAEDYDALYEILEEFCQEAAQIESQMGNNTRHIREAEAYLAVYRDSEPDDIKVFSPRKTETFYKEEIQKKQTEKSVYEERNQELGRKKDILEKRISILQDVLSRQEKTFQSQAEAAKEQYRTSMKELKGLVDRIESSSASIDRNPVQARQDFAIIARRLRETVDRMRNILGEEGRGGEESQGDRWEALTARERQVLEYIAEGMSNKEIASSLDISEQTVKNHLSGIFRKLGVMDRTQAAILAIRESV